MSSTQLQAVTQEDPPPVKQANFKVNLKILAKSSNFMKINYSLNQVNLMDFFQAGGSGSKVYQFDKIINEYVSCSVHSYKTTLTYHDQPSWH